MRIIKIVPVVVVCVASIFWSSCSLIKPSTPVETKLQFGSVQRGDIAVNITATGNLAYAQVEKPAFQLSGVAGAGGGTSYVAEVLVEVGDTVKKGQLIATLDTTQWEKHLQDLEDALTSTKRNVTAKERALSQAQLSVQNAEYSLNTIGDVQEAFNKVEDAKNALTIFDTNYQQALLVNAPTNVSAVDIGRTRNDIIQRITNAQKELNDVLSGHNTTLSNQTQARELDAQVQLKKFQLDLARSQMEDAEISISDARRAQAEAQKNLDTDKAVATTVVSPIDGVVTQVGVAGGDQVSKGKVAALVVDPNKFEAVVLVGEKDIFSLNVGKQATVSVDAMPTLSYPAKIVSIAPSATPQQGVVNYQVKIEVDTTQPVSPTQSGQRARPSTGAGTGQAAAGANRQGFTSSSTGQAPAGAAAQYVQLREGLSITVNMSIAESKNALLVPNRAITRQGGSTMVQVVKDAVTTSVPITIGLSDVQYTEVTGGLNEGDQVVLQQVTAASSTRSPFQGPGGGFGIAIPKSPAR